MTLELEPLRELPKLAALYIADCGWVQGDAVSRDGRASLTGALLHCSPVPGYGAVAREVLRRAGHGEAWNDDADRTAQEVVTYLRSVEVTDAELGLTFGPQWHEVVSAVRTVASIGPADALRLSRPPSGSFIAWRSMSGAAAADGRARCVFAAVSAASDAAWSAVLPGGDPWGDNLSIARDAIAALVVRDLIGVHGLTQEHYDELTRPWRAVLGHLHADDAEVVVPV